MTRNPSSIQYLYENYPHQYKQNFFPHVFKYTRVLYITKGWCLCFSTQLVNPSPPIFGSVRCGRKEVGCPSN